MKRFKEKSTGVINAADLKTIKGKFVFWLIFAFLALVCIMCLVPTFWTLMTGFKTSKEIYTSAKFFPSNLSFALIGENLRTAWKAMDAVRASLNTLIICIASTLFTLVIDGLGGYVLSRLKPTGSKVMFALIVWTMMMPSQIRTVPLYISYISFPFVGNFPFEVNLMNTYWPMILSGVANAFTVMLFKNNFDSVSISYVEAAKLDGCNNLRVFFNIMVPLSVPIIMYVAIGCMRAPWGDFFTPFLVLTDKERQTLPVKIYLLSTSSSIKMNTYMLCLILSSIPGFLIFVLFQRYILGGINVGGVKG